MNLEYLIDENYEEADAITDPTGYLKFAIGNKFFYGVMI